MKKSRLLSFFLSAALLTTLLLPWAAAEEAGGSSGFEPIRAKAALLVDADYNEVLYEENAHETMYPASITKLMTALLVAEAIEAGQFTMDTVVTVPDNAFEGLSKDGSTQNIKAGERLTVKDLFYCLLVASANEAANILALQVSGSLSAFVDQMNQKAADLGCEGTHFANPHGLHDPDHYTTAWDLYLLARTAMEYPIIQEAVSAQEYYVPATNLSEQRHFFNTNGLLSRLKYSYYYYPDAIGIKTGSTDAAGLCLVSAARRDGRTLYAVVLGAEQVDLGDRVQLEQFSESIRLLEHGFSDFTRQTLIDPNEFVTSLRVTLSKTADQVILHPAEKLEAFLPKGADLNDLEPKITLYVDGDSVEAPVAQGQVLGSITLTYEGRDYGPVDLVALDSVERSEWLYRQQQISQFLGQAWVKLVLVAVLILAAVLLLRATVFSRRRRYGGRTRSGGGSRGYRGRRR